MIKFNPREVIDNQFGRPVGGEPGCMLCELLSPWTISGFYIQNAGKNPIWAAASCQICTEIQTGVDIYISKTISGSTQADSKPGKPQPENHFSDNLKGFIRRKPGGRHALRYSRRGMGRAGQCLSLPGSGAETSGPMAMLMGKWGSVADERRDGWGTWIRTRATGVRVRGSTAKLSPSGIVATRPAL